MQVSFLIIEASRMEKMISFSVIFSILLVTCFAHPPEDQVTDLPGLNFNTTYRQYSGYLNGTTGRMLHYWLVESQNNPSTDPWVLWLNGGPGCSSLDGLLTENGPFVVSADGTTLIENVYSWNKIANVLYLESPACVGFSYDINNNCATDDNEVAEMNYLALQNFIEKFPEYINYDFYITGESYAGIYVPTLSIKVVDGLETFPLQFKGYAIGNGVLDNTNNQNSLMFFGYYHAVLGQELWDTLVLDCCNGVESKETCNFASGSLQCQANVVKATNIMYNQGLNLYNLLGDCTPTSPPAKSRYSYEIENLFKSFNIELPEPYGNVPCINSYKETVYLNQPDVRAALHIPDYVQDWEICSNTVSNSYGRIYNSMKTELAYLNTRARGLIYNGDNDMVCNWLGDDWTVRDLGFKVTDSYKRWMVNNDVAGYGIRYENIDFLMVRGSGHMVPQDKPPQALSMLNSFINDLPYGE